MTTNRLGQDQTLRSTTEPTAERVAAIPARMPGGRRCAPPQLTVVCTADLLEALGPAQANYRGP